MTRVPEQQPNFLVLVSDTFRHDHLGAYGNDWVGTPNLDRLAAEGVTFDRHISDVNSMAADVALLGRHYGAAAPLPTELQVRMLDLMARDKARESFNGCRAPRPVHISGRGQSVRSGSSVTPLSCARQ